MVIDRINEYSLLMLANILQLCDTCPKEIIEQCPRICHSSYKTLGLTRFGAIYYASLTGPHLRMKPLS